MVYYILYSPTLREIYEYHVDDDYVYFDFKHYTIVYLIKSDRLVIIFRCLGKLLGVAEAIEYLDVEVHSSTLILDALENLLRESIVLYEGDM